MMNVRSTANTSSKATLWKVFILILAIIVNVVLAVVGAAESRFV